MGKKIPDTELDAQLSVLEGDAVHVCSAEPLNHTEASSTLALATQAIAGGNYAKANGDTSGRKSTLTPPTGTSIGSSGTGNHVAVTSGTTLKQVTTCPAQALTVGGTVDIGALVHEIADPA